MLTVTADAIRNKFLVNAHRDTDMTTEEADALADFFVGIGDHMLDKLTPVMKAYRSRVEDKIRNDVIDEILSDLHVSTTGPMVNRNNTLAKIKLHKKFQ